MTLAIHSPLTPVVPPVHPSVSSVMGGGRLAVAVADDGHGWDTDR